MNTPYEIKKKLDSLSKWQQWAAKGGLTSEVARLGETIQYYEAELLKSELYFSDAEINRRNEEYKQTVMKFYNWKLATGQALTKFEKKEYKQFGGK